MAAEGGDGDKEEAAAIEWQLEQQLDEQKASLAAVEEALAAEPSNLELLAVREELLLAIKDVEEGLLHLKQSKLLKKMDAIFCGQESASEIGDIEAESLDPAEIQPEPLESPEFCVGSKCRFRHTNGRWYNGHVVGFDSAAGSARVSFLTPTAENMLICKFFLQQRCRFGSNCRLSHGFVVPISSLKQYIPTIWQQSLVGSNILAVSGHPSGIWKKAELESWDDELYLGDVVFQEDGTSAKLSSNSLSISEYAEMSEGNEESSSTEGSEFSEEEDGQDDETIHQGLGFLEATKLQKGVQTETAVFAKWEHHTRGIASKMMASMGYREGMGLGASGQGMVDPISVKVLPAKQSLDNAVTSSEIEGSSDHSRKHSRGGKRKRDKKYAEAARAAKAEEGQQANVFSFINSQLSGQDGGKGSGSKITGGLAMKEDRRSLVAYDDEVKELRSRVEKLEEMVKRNRKDKAVFEAASRKLDQTRKALADAEAAHASACKAVVNKEKEKKWLRF